jgi:hypothetical protein
VATKRADISSMIKNDMASRTIGNTSETPTLSELKNARKQKEAIKIRLDEGDYAKLQEIAERQGSKASIMIRQAVKQIIRTQGNGY